MFILWKQNICSLIKVKRFFNKIVRYSWMAQLIVYGTILNLIPEINDLMSGPIRKLTEQNTFQVNIR